MNMDDVFVPLSEFNNRVKEVEKVTGDVLSAYHLNKLYDMKTEVSPDEEPYILQYPFTESSADFAIGVVQDTIGDSDTELNDEILKDVKNLAETVFKGRVKLLSMSTIPSDVYRSVKQHNEIKLFLSTDKTRVLMRHFNNESSAVNVVHMPHKLGDTVRKRSSKPHDDMWSTYIVMNDPVSGDTNTYDMGLVNETEMINTLVKIVKQYTGGDKVISL